MKPPRSPCALNETRSRRLVEPLRCGRRPRRDCIARLAAAGPAAPMASMLLVHACAQPACRPCARR